MRRCWSARRRARPGRTELTEQLAQAQVRSLRRLALLGDEVAVWPTHGAGSFCIAPSGQADLDNQCWGRPPTPCCGLRRRTRSSTPLLTSLRLPPYFLSLAEQAAAARLIKVVGRSTVLTVEDVHRLRRAGAEVIDVPPSPTSPSGTS